MGKKKKKKTVEQNPIVETASFGLSSEELLNHFFEEDFEILDEHDNGYETERDADDNETGPNLLYLFKFDEKYGVFILPGYDETPDFFCFKELDAAQKCFIYMQEEGVRPFKERIEICKKAVGRSDFYIKDKWGLYEPSYQIFCDRNLILDNVSLEPNIIREALDRYDKFKTMLSDEGFELESIYKNREWNDNQRYFVFVINDESGCPLIYDEHIPSKIQGRARCTLDFFPMEEFKKYITPEEREKRQKERAEKEIEYQKWAKERDEYLKTQRIITKEQFQNLCMFIRPNQCDGTMKQTKKWIALHALQQNEERILRELKYMGGYCDCEVIMNCSEYFD